MATDHDFGEFTVEVAARPVAGVTVGEIPAKLAEYLDTNVPTLRKDDGTWDVDQELVLRAASEKDAKTLAGYAKAWGARQTPPVQISKVSNGKRYGGNVARLQASDFSDEQPKRGRPTGTRK